MKFAVIVASQRPASQSAKVGRAISAALVALDPTHEVYTLDLGAHPLPLWDEGKWQAGSAWGAVWGPVSAELKGADAVVLITPEWSGMATPAAKNLLLLCDAGELAHKAGLIVSVSSGRGGSYPVAELRMSSYKNTRVCWIPDHLIIREVGAEVREPALWAEGALLAEGEGGEPLAPTLSEERLRFCVETLCVYAEALRAARGRLPRDDRFRNGL
jgi:chromate reductase